MKFAMPIFILPPVAEKARISCCMLHKSSLIYYSLGQSSAHIWFENWETEVAELWIPHFVLNAGMQTPNYFNTSFTHVAESSCRISFHTVGLTSWMLIAYPVSFLLRFFGLKLMTITMTSSNADKFHNQQIDLNANLILSLTGKIAILCYVWCLSVIILFFIKSNTLNFLDAIDRFWSCDNRIKTSVKLFTYLQARSPVEFVCCCLIAQILYPHDRRPLPN